VQFPFRSFFTDQTFPIVLLWDIHLPFIRRFGILIGHFQNQHLGQLCQVIAIPNARIAQGIAKGPDFGDYLGGVDTH